MAALKAKRRNPNAAVILPEKANAKGSSAISMGMDGLNNAIIPDDATPEQYTKEMQPMPEEADGLRDDQRQPHDAEREA